MSAASTTEKVESKVKESIENGLDNAVEMQTKITAAFETATKRSMRIAAEWTDAVTGSQRELIELYKKIAEDPKAYNKNVEACMDSMTGLQKRTLDFSKVVYTENANAAVEMKELFQPFFVSNEKFREGAQQFINAWAKPYTPSAS